MIFVLLALTTAAAAPCVESASVETGAVASCSGILVPEAWVLDCVKCQTVSLPECAATKTFLEASMTVEINTLRTELGIERRTSTELRVLLDNPVSAPPKWYEHPVLWGSLGAVAGISVAVRAVLQ